jgi:dihydroorotate dehydrogenase (fumarate)
MTDLSTTWLGLPLRSPLVVAACPLSDDSALLEQLVAAGAGAVVMRSLFEEQIVAEQMAAHRHIDAWVDTNAEARSFLPDRNLFPVGVEPYLAQLKKLRQRLGVPVLASLNGATPGGWTDLARQLEDAGASAIELNLYDLPGDPGLSSAAIEDRQAATVGEVVRQVGIPVSVKLSATYTSVPAFAQRLAEEGAAGVVLFNRFYQPDIRLDSLDLDTTLTLSTAAELPPRLHALALLHGRIPLSLAATGGIHTGLDAAKALLCGADVMQLASVLLQGGPAALTAVLGELHRWLSDNGYDTVNEARGILSLENAPDPTAWERLNYMKLLQGWQSRPGQR